MKNTFYKILSLGLLFTALGAGFSLMADEEVLLPDESTEEVLVAKSLEIEELFVLDESVTEELVKKAIEIEESITEELDADKLVEQLVEMVNEYNKSSRPDAPTAYNPGTVIGPDCDLTPIMNLLGTIISRIGLVTDKTSLKKTVLGILGDPNSVLGTDYTVVKALKEIIDFLDTEHVITKADTPYVISTPGKYTVIEYIDKSFTGTFAILIDCDNVTLDLNGYTIINTDAAPDTATQGVVINPGHRNHVIKDGSLIGFGYGFNASDPEGNLKVLSLTCKDNTVLGLHFHGLTFPSSSITNVLVEDCVCDFNSQGAKFSGFENIVIRNSSFNNNVGLLPLTVVHGLELFNGSRAIVENCTANENTSSSTDVAVSCEGFLAQADEITFLNCEASFNGNSDNSNRGIGFSLQNNRSILKNCTANGNYGVGYDTDPDAGGLGIYILGNDCLFENCVLNTNTQHGIFFDTTGESHIINCQFINNGQFGINVNAGSNDLYFISNKFINNGSVAAVTPAANVNNAGTRNVFMSNTAFMNIVPGVNYDDTLGVSSGLSISAWSLAGGAPVPTWPIDNLDITP